MTSAKVFRSGNSQAVRLPKEFQLDVNEVEIFRRGNEIVLLPRPKCWDDYFKYGRRFTDDFPEEIEDSPPTERVSL